MLNLFQHPSCSKIGSKEAKWTLKQVQGDGTEYGVLDEVDVLSILDDEKAEALGPLLPIPTL